MSPFSCQSVDVLGGNPTHTRPFAAYDHAEWLMEGSGIACRFLDGWIAPYAAPATRVMRCAWEAGLWIASARSGVVNEVFFGDTDDLELISIARIAKSEVWGYRVAGDK